jgi:hypothetical protein
MRSKIVYDLKDRISETTLRTSKLILIIQTILHKLWTALKEILEHFIVTTMVKTADNNGKDRILRK